MASARPIGGSYCTVNPEGSGSVQIEGFYGSYTVQAIPNEGWHFVEFSIVSFSGVCKDIAGRVGNLKSQYLTINNSEEDGARVGRLVLSCTFAPNGDTPGGGGGEEEEDERYALTTSVSPNEKAGTVSPEGTTYYKKGTSVSVSAFETDRGYRFDFFTVDGALNRSNPVSVTMDRSHTVVAYFRLKYHGILYSPKNGNRIICHGECPLYV